MFANDVRARPWPAIASLAAMVAGVAVFVAIWSAGSAARGAFLAAVDAVAGRATHEITRPGGVDEARFAVFATLRGVEAAQPQVEGVLTVARVTRGGREVRLGTRRPFACSASTR